MPTTTNYGWTLPTVGADSDTWGTELNAAFDEADADLAAVSAVANAAVTLTGSQTLTNKTLTSPIIAQISNTGTLTLPTSTDTLVGRATTDTLTNKTLTAPIIAQISNTGTLTLPTSTDTLVGRATTDTLANKTLTSPAINSPTIAGGTVKSRIPTSSETTGTLTSASANATVQCSGGITLDDGVFTEGDYIMFDAGGSNRTFTRAAGLTMYVAGSDSASATLLANTMGSAYWRSASVVVLSGTFS